MRIGRAHGRLVIIEGGGGDGDGDGDGDGLAAGLDAAGLACRVAEERLNAAWAALSDAGRMSWPK